MSTVHEAVVAILRADANVTALVGDRIYPTRRPQHDPTPAIVYYAGAETDVPAMGSGTRIHRPRFSFDCWHEQASSARAVAAAVRSALVRYRGVSAGVVIQDAFFLNEQDLYDQTKNEHRTSVDIEVIYERAP